MSAYGIGQWSGSSNTLKTRSMDGRDLLNGGSSRLCSNGCDCLREGTLQLSETPEDRSVRAVDGWKDYVRQIHDDSGRNGRRGGEDYTHKPSRGWGSRTPQGYKKESEMAWGEKSHPLRRRGRPAEILEPVDRRHGRKAGRGSRIHDRRQGENWHERRYHRRSGRSGLSRRFLTREEMALQKPHDMVEGAQVRTKADMGCCQQGRQVVGPERQHPMAGQEITRTQHIRPLQAIHGETPKSRHPLPSQHDGHEDRVERRTEPIGDAQLVI